jgi:hypothetical protein
MLSEWNKFVKKIYRAGKAENSEFTFGEALKEASKRKQEMKGGNADAAPAPAVTVHAPAQVESAPAPAKVGGKKSKTANKRSKRGGKTLKVKSCKK